jgi:hypothetical protein
VACRRLAPPRRGTASGRMACLCVALSKQPNRGLMFGSLPYFLPSRPSALQTHHGHPVPRPGMKIAPLHPAQAPANERLRVKQGRRAPSSAHTLFFSHDGWPKSFTLSLFPPTPFFPQAAAAAGVLYPQYTSMDAVLLVSSVCGERAVWGGEKKKKRIRPDGSAPDSLKPFASLPSPRTRPPRRRRPRQPRPPHPLPLSAKPRPKRRRPH